MKHSELGWTSTTTRLGTWRELSLRRVPRNIAWEGPVSPGHVANVNVCKIEIHASVM